MNFQLSESRRPLVRPVDGVPDICAPNSTKEHEHLEKEPAPAATFLLVDLAATTTGTGPGISTACVVADAVQVVRRDRDDVLVVTDLTCFTGQAEVRNRGQGNIVLLRVQREAVRPRPIRLVLEVEAEELVLEVGQARLGRNRCVPKTASLVRRVRKVR